MLRELQQIDDENDYHVIIHTKDQTHWTPTAKNLTLHVVPYDAYTFGEQLGFARFLRSLNADLVHFTMPQQPLLYFGRRITTIHDLTLVRFQNLDKNKIIYTIEQNIFKFLLKNVARRSKLVITPTKFVKGDVVEYTGISPDKVVVTYEAEAPLAKLKPTPIKSLQGKDFILYVGNAFPHKNLSLLAEAFELLQEKYPKLHLALAGKKDFFYEQLEKETGHIKNLHILGFISDEQLLWAYNHTKAYVFPSLSEGFGLPGIDALHHDIPLISSDATCLPEVYGDAAHYFDANSAEDAARAIDEVLRSKSRQEELIKNGRIQRDKYSWRKLASKTHSAYVRILTKK
jgi:glycosyltransferase involved in cell wall biosynthesis